MKRIIVVAISMSFAACGTQEPSGKNVGPDNPDPNADLYACHSDADCAYPGAGATTCAADGTCVATRVAHVSWTVSGEAASAGTCDAAPQLDLAFWYEDTGFDYSPVPCADGEFTIDNFPVAFTRVDARVGLLRDGDHKGGAIAMFEYPTGNATLDLPYSPAPSEAR